MQNDMRDAIEKEMRVLRVQYLEKLKFQVQQLESFLSAAKSNSLNNEDIAELKMQAHKLAGTGATYGYPYISEAGENLEDMLIENRTGNAQTATLILTLLNACIAAQSSTATNNKEDI